MMIKMPLVGRIGDVVEIIRYFRFSVMFIILLGFYERYFKRVLNISIHLCKITSFCIFELCIVSLPVMSILFTFSSLNYCILGT